MKMVTKIRKFKQDMPDYIQGKVYKWVQEEDTQYPSTTGHQTNQSDTTTADSDFPSDSNSNRS